MRIKTIVTFPWIELRCQIFNFTASMAGLVEVQPPSLNKPEKIAKNLSFV